MAGQPIGGFPGPEDPILIFNGGDIGLKLFVSMSTVIEGKLRGLHSEDIARFEDETYGDDRIATFLKTGQGLRSPSAIKFLPDAIYMVITPELEDTVRVLGPFPKYNTLEDVGGEPLPVAEGVDCPEAPPPSEDDESRLAIVTALGSSEAQMEVLEENQRLKTLRCRFLRVQDKICTIELFNAIGKITVSLRDGVHGEDKDGSLVWRIPLEKNEKRCFVVANNIPSLEIEVSGIRSQMRRMSIGSLPCGKFLIGTFDNDAQIFGRFVSESVPGMNSDKLDEMAEQFLAGEQSFPAAMTLEAGFIQFPLASVQNVLDVLGVSAEE